MKIKGIVLLLLLLTIKLSADDFEILVDTVKNEDFNKFKIFMQSEFDVSDRNEYGSTPLLWLSGLAEPKYIEYLVSIGADINEVVEDPSGKDGQDGHTGLVIAAWGGNEDLVKYFLKNGTDRSFLPKAMREASMEGRGDVVKELIPYMDNIDLYGEKSYMAFAINWAKYGAADVVKQLLDAGADPNADPYNAYGVTHFLAEGEVPEITKIFLDLDIDWNKTTHWGATPIFFAINNSLPTTRALLEKGVDLDVISLFSGYTPLHEAVEKNALYAVQLLVDAGAPINVKSKGSYSENENADLTPLELARDRGYGDIAMVLLGRKRVEIPDFSLEDEIAFGSPFNFSNFYVSEKMRAFNGEIKEISDFFGKVILRNIWATWCPPCRQEMPSLQSLYEKYNDEGLVVLAESIDKSQPDAQQYMMEFGLTFPGFHYRESDGAEIPARQYPTTYIYDRDGRAITSIVGSRDWMSKKMIGFIEKILKADY